VIGTAALVALASTLLFTGLVLVNDRPRGALMGQIGSALAGVLTIGALVSGDGTFEPDRPAFRWSALGVALLAASVSGMFYHLYLGRFDDVWRARRVFALVYLGLAAVLGTLYLSLLR